MNTSNYREATFHFRVEKIKDEENKVIGENKLPSATLQIPNVDLEDLSNLLTENEKVREFVLELVNEAILNQAREQINSFREKNEVGTLVTQDSIDCTKLSLEFLSNMPKAERRSTKISEEDYSSFFDAFLEVMPAITGRAAQKIKLSIDVFAKKFATVKHSKDILNFLKNDLLLFMAKNESLAKEHEAVLSDLINRADKFLNAESKDLLAALM